jgi:hypothetical protein
MKLIAGISTLIALATANPSGRTGAPVTPVWMKSFLSWENPMTGPYYYTLTETAVPNAGSIAWNACSGVGGLFGEPFCPDNAAVAEEVYSNLLAEHFMPLSVAAGEFQFEEVDKIQTFALGARAQVLAPPGPQVIPDPIDHTTLTLHDQSANDVYKCGTNMFGGKSIFQWDEFAAPPAYGPGWTDDTTISSKGCLNLGGHRGFNDTWAPMTMKNMPCTSSSFLICRASEPMAATTHSGAVTVVKKNMNTVNVEIVKAAFNAAYNSEFVTPVPITQAPVTTATEEPAKKKGNMMQIIGGIVIIVVIVVVVALKK